MNNKELTEVAGIDESEENAQNEDFISDDKMIQVVSFSLLNDVEYGINILQIHEILKIIDVTRLPNTPPFIKGVINLRGNVIPVVNVRIRFGYKESKITDESRIIVVGINGRLVGLLVDNVFQVFRIPLKDINPASEMIEGVSAEFIQSVGRMKDRLIVILKLDNILFPDEKNE
ncbi:MAG: chemotaxis protein CheW [Spirochaetota bacterium]